MKVATARCSANLALLKYWGVNIDGQPLSPSLSIPLSNCWSETEVNLLPDSSSKEVLFLKSQNVVEEAHQQRVYRFIDRVLVSYGASKYGYRVTTFNSMPMGVGLASSASGFASLATCLAKLLNISVFDNRLMSLLADESGSALRSLRQGVVEWIPISQELKELHELNKFNIVVFACIVSKKHKSVFSREMHKRVSKSPLIFDRIESYQERYQAITKAMKDYDWHLFSQVITKETLSFILQAWSCPQREAMLTQASMDLWTEVMSWQKNENLPVCVSFDAGPTVLVLARPDVLPTVQKKLAKIPYIQEVIVNE